MHGNIHRLLPKDTPESTGAPADHYADELEPLLETIILEDFNVQAEDGSPLQVWCPCRHCRCT